MQTRVRNDNVKSSDVYSPHPPNRKKRIIREQDVEYTTA